jgi:MoxR-like ATPase
MPRIKKSSAAPMRLLRSLNLFGLDHLDPVILAALTDERPLLLIGPHGTAKSELLNRLATVLKLEHRHYNASLIAFDDLLGYPVPNAARDGLTYLRTAGDLWQAESVFLDEISRCRPETQNKLFAIVHEKRVQGLPLQHLRYRWAAMNPPVTADMTDDAEVYEGSLPLDPALADRFPWVVPLPVLAEMSREDRLALIGGGDALPATLPDVAGLVEQARTAIADFPLEYRAWCGVYVDALVPPLLAAKFGISGRRAVHLARGILAVQASCQVLELGTKLTDAAFLALKYGLPQRAQGRSMTETKLKAIHREALNAAGTPAESPWHQLRNITNPVERVVAAVPLYPGKLNRSEVSSLVSDAFAGLSKPRQYLLARHLLPIASQTGCLNVPTFELLSGPAWQVRMLTEGGQQSITMPRNKTAEWDALIAAINKARKGDPTVDELGNTLLTLHVVEKESFDPHELIALDRAWAELFRPLLAEPSRLSA